MSQFIVVDRNGFRRVPIGRQMTIGRSASNVLVLNAMFASRRHAWVWRQGDRFIIEDLSSTNGTFVNGHRVTVPQFLKHNDMILVGDAQLTFVAAWEPSAARTPPRGTPHWGPGRAQRRRSFTPTDPVVARPFSAPRAPPARRRGDVWMVVLLLVIVAALLLTILGVLAAYVLL
ncbi:MAG: FHA domain-containing protein [Anaerolineae bacterium]|jgi:hypothetical protein